MRAGSRAFLITLCAGLVAMSGAFVTAPPAAADQARSCPPVGGGGPPGSDGPLFTDNGVSAFAGGDYLADGGAAESEGLLVVGGDATVAKTGGGTYNVGTAGVGSGIDPEPDADMLVVGGEVSVATSTVLSVGASVNGSPAGGAVRVGGQVTGTLDANGGPVTTGLGSAALAAYSGVPALLRSTSDDLADAPTTGDVTSSGPQLTLAGDGTGDRQVFRVTSARLSATSEVRLTGIPDDAAVVITVTDAGAVTFSPNFVSINGVRVDDFAAADNGFARAASSLLWNFPSTAALTLGGSNQFMGSVLLPSTGSALDVTASTNGRLYVGGDIHTHGTGNEHHNYPWRPPFGCLAGSFAVGKLVTGSAAGDVPATYTVRYTYPGGSGAVDVAAGGALVDGPQLPRGTVVTFSEVLPGVPDVEWVVPVITVDGVPTDQLTVGAGTARIVVTNTATPTEPDTPTPPDTSEPGSSGPGSSAPGSSGSSSSAGLAPTASGRPMPGVGAVADTGARPVPTLTAGGVLVVIGSLLVGLALPRRQTRRH